MPIRSLRLSAPLSCRHSSKSLARPSPLFRSSFGSALPRSSSTPSQSSALHQQPQSVIRCDCRFGHSSILDKLPISLDFDASSLDSFVSAPSSSVSQIVSLCSPPPDQHPPFARFSLNQNDTSQHRQNRLNSFHIKEVPPLSLSALPPSHTSPTPCQSQRILSNRPDSPRSESS